jgi:hypothetical protein
MEARGGGGGTVEARWRRGGGGGEEGAKGKPKARRACERSTQPGQDATPFFAYRWSQAVGCFEQRANRAEGAKNDAKHDFESMRVQPSPRATLPNAPLLSPDPPLSQDGRKKEAAG